MADYFKTRGIILKIKEAGEVDAIFSAYTEDSGKIEIFAKGLRKINSKLKGHLQPPSLNNLEITVNKTYRLIGASAINGFIGIKKNCQSLENTLFICEITDKLISHPLKDLRLWLILNSALGKINQKPPLAEYINILFQAKLIQILGYEPDASQIKNGVVKELFKSGRIIDVKIAKDWLRNYINSIIAKEQ